MEKNKKVLRLNEDIVENLNQYYDSWLDHSTSEEEAEETHILYEGLTQLIERGNPYVEYEISESPDGEMSLVVLFGTTMGVCFFEEAPRMVRFTKIFDSLNNTVEGLNQVSISVGQSLGLRYFDYKVHNEMHPNSDSEDNPGYGNLAAWKTRDAWTTSEVAQALYDNYYGDCARSAQNLKLSITHTGEVVIDVDVMMSKVNYGIHLVYLNQYAAYIEVDNSATSIPKLCREFGWNEVNINTPFAREYQQYNTVIDDINNDLIMKMLNLLKTDGHPETRIDDEARYQLCQLVDKKLNGKEGYDSIRNVLSYTIEVLRERMEMLPIFIRNITKKMK